MSYKNILQRSQGFCLTFSSIHLYSNVQLFINPWTTACQASLSITSSQSLLKLMSIESVKPPNHLIICYPLLLPPSIFPSIRVFSDESVLHIKVLEFQLQHQSFQWIFRTDFLWLDWLDLLAVQETLKSLLQHQFKSINSLALSFLYSPTPTSMLDFGRSQSRSDLDCR